VNAYGTMFVIKKQAAAVAEGYGGQGSRLKEKPINL